MSDEKMRTMLSALAEAVLDFNGRTPIELAQEALDFLASDYPEGVCALCGRAQPCNDCKGAA